MYRLPRTFRLRQQISPLRRQRLSPFHTSRHSARPQLLYRSNGEPVRFQAVRFKKPGLTVRRLATLAIYTSTIYFGVKFLFRYLDVEIELVEEEEAEEQRQQNPEAQDAEEDEDDEDDLYAEEDSTFIPMTWAKKCPRQFYKGSDPEWQEFVKVAKDKTRHRKIQDELVQIVYSGSLQHPLINKQLGKEPKIGKYWLDISFPDGPPQEYERSGLEIGDGFIAWSQQKVTAENQWRVTRALWPTAAAGSIWATTKVLMGIQWRRAKQALGWESADPLSPEERYRHAMEMMAKHQAARDNKEVGKARLESEGASGTIATSSDSQQPSPRSNDGRRLPWSLSVQMPKVPNPFSQATNSGNTDIPIAMHVFSATLSKQWNPQKSEPPRGTFVVQGLVEVRGVKGRFLFDVQSCYDPKAAKYVAVNAKVRNFKRWNQAPKGGP